MKKPIILAAVFVMFVCPLTAFALEARVDEVSVAKDGALTISFAVKDAFKREIEDAVKSGMPAEFIFSVELKRERAVMPDELLVRLKFKHKVRYDSLKEQYEVSREETADTITTKDAVEMKRIMNTCAGVSIGPGLRLKPEEKYHLRIKAELKTSELPFILDYALFFLKSLDVETDWRVYNVTQ